MATNSGLKIYIGGQWKEAKDYWAYIDGQWRQGKNLWVFVNGEWKKLVNPERKITNWTFSPLKSDTTAYPGNPWNNSDFRTGYYGGANYQGFAFGKPVGSCKRVTYLRLRITRNTGSGGDYGGNIVFKHSSHTNTTTPPSSIPTSLSSESCSMPLPNRGASGTKAFTSESDLNFWTKWINTSGCLSSYMSGNTNIYCGITSIVIEEMRYTV